MDLDSDWCNLEATEQYKREEDAVTLLSSFDCLVVKVFIEESIFVGSKDLEVGQ